MSSLPPFFHSCLPPFHRSKFFFNKKKILKIKKTQNKKKKRKNLKIKKLENKKKFWEFWKNLKIKKLENKKKFWEFWKNSKLKKLKNKKKKIFLKKLEIKKTEK